MEPVTNCTELPVTEPTKSLAADLMSPIDRPRPARPIPDQPKPYSAPLFGCVEDDLTWFAFVYGIEIGVLVGILVFKLFTLESV